MSKIRINQDSLRTAREWKRHKISEGSNVYRILPPFGNAEVHNNYPYRKWNICWLLDPKTSRKLPFASPFTDGEDACPVHEYSKILQQHVEDKRNELKSAGKTDAQIKEELKALNELAWEMRVQKVFAYNAVDKSGNVGLLELKATAHKKMKAMMSQYIQDYQQDPTSLMSEDDDSGVWFNIIRSGMGKETEYDVQFNQQLVKINGKSLREDDRSPLQESVVSNYEAELGYDLNSIYRRKSYKELRQILVANLALISKEIPDVVFPDYADEVANYLGDDTPPFEVESTPMVKPKIQGKSKVAIQLDTEDDDDEEVVAAPTRSKSSADMSLEELKAMADSILGG